MSTSRAGRSGSSELLRRNGRVIPFLGDLLAFRREPLVFLTDLSRQGDAIVPIRLGWRTIYLLNDPELIRDLLHIKASNYRKNYGALRPLCGLSILLTDGGVWRDLRRTAQPAFHAASIEKLLPDLERAAADLVSRWRAIARSNEPLDVCPEMLGASIGAVFRAFLGNPRGLDPYEIALDMHTALQAAGQRGFRLTALFERVPTPRQRAVRAAEARLHELPDELLSNNGGTDDTLLDQLVAARDDPDCETFDDRQLHNEIMTYIVAGSDTMAAALSWALYLLATRPAVVEALRDEASRVFRDTESMLEALPRLALTTRVLKESLRLYPPAWLMSRTALRPDRIGDLSVAPETRLVVSTYSLHRDPRFWDEPDRFDPDRFLPEREKSRPAYTFLPFGAGGRTCIGSHFALRQGVLVLAKLARHFDFSLPEGFRAEPETGITMKPRRLPMYVQARD
ncbi:MAG TPA: cytochrome P450 [Kiloniellales bacterium]|nr:cytochrome P450 [Kiloniellales bacterium]